MTDQKNDAARINQSLVDAVEGLPGYGTVRNADGVRLKDHPAWVAFYVATKNAGAEKTLRGNCDDCVGGQCTMNCSSAELIRPGENR